MEEDEGVVTSRNEERGLYSGTVVVAEGWAMGDGRWGRSWMIDEQ